MLEPENLKEKRGNENPKCFGLLLSLFYGFYLVLQDVIVINTFALTLLYQSSSAFFLKYFEND